MPLPVFVPWRPEWVLFEDADVLAVDKPAGVSTHAPDDARRDDVVSRLRAWWLASGDARDPYLGIHQRLDRDTSGVLLMARSRAANKGLASVFEGRRAEKRYLAAVESGSLAERGTVEHDLVPGDEGTMRALPPGRGGPKAQRAITRWRVVERVGRRSLVSLEPLTGRTHQLRVQMAALGAPLAGDTVYGGPVCARLLLHAASLSVEHPTRGGALRVEAPVPEMFRAWVRGEGDPRDLVTKLREAADRRWQVASDPKTTAFRLASGGDGLRDAVDVYGEHAVVHCYGLRDEALLDAVAAMGFRGVYLKLRPKQASTLVETRRDDVAPKEPVRGAPAPEEFAVLERGLKYRVRLGDGLSTGIFLDQRENRQRVRALSKGLRVLNLFAYTGPFTVAAAEGGAKRTVTVDLSRAALDWCERNLAENGLSDARHTTVASDVFPWLDAARARGDRFDLVIADPPSYSTARGSRFRAESDWRTLGRALMALVAPGGKLLASTNHHGLARLKFRRQLHEAARDAGREVVQMKDLPPPEDHPPAPGEYPHLKCVLITLR